MDDQPSCLHAEDSALIAAYRLGDEKAFRPLVDRHISSVYAFLFQLVRDRATAEDLVQETFLKVWRHLDRYQSEKPFRTWLFAIAKNNAYDWLRKKRPLPFSAFVTDADETPFTNIPDQAPLPDEFLMRADATADVDRAIGQLPEKYRALVSLVYQEGFTLHEAAEILEESYNTVKSRHQRAMFQLRSLLSDTNASRSA